MKKTVEMAEYCVQESTFYGHLQATYLPDTLSEELWRVKEHNLSLLDAA